MTVQFWKNPAPRAKNEFEVPQFACLACNDTGIVHNADGFLAKLLGGEYDQQHDLALVCWCHAAYPSKELNEKGKPKRAGYRTDGGALVDIDPDRSTTVPIGASCPKEIVARLQRQRYEAWQEMKFLAEWAREEAKKDPDFRPEWIKAGYDQIDTTDWKVTNIRGLSSVGQVLFDQYKKPSVAPEPKPF